MELKISTFNCKCYMNNKKYILSLIRKCDICFLTETWMGNWDPETLCDIKLAQRHVYTTSRKRHDKRRGRHGCMTAFIINDKY